VLSQKHHVMSADAINMPMDYMFMISSTSASGYIQIMIPDSNKIYL